MSDSSTLPASGCPVHGAQGAADVDHAQLDFSQDMSYGDYLQLDAILSAQRPLSPNHNEMLFIVQHQTSELWMKLLLHELQAAMTHVADNHLEPAFKMLARVSKIMEQLVHAWDVLATMTPPEYTAIRPYLDRSSGFQSHQYRCIEFSLGNKNPVMLAPHQHHPERLRAVQTAYEAPSLYDLSLKLMPIWGIAVPQTCLERDWRQAHRLHPEVERAWLQVYTDPTRYWPLYQLAEKLVDLEDAFRLWRFRHVTTVERVIGFKRGSGGTGGVSYLKKMLDVVLFPELWSLRTHL